MKKTKLVPFVVISYLSGMHKNYKQNCVHESEYEIADEIYFSLLKAYHVYVGMKKDYRKKK